MINSAERKQHNKITVHTKVQKYGMLKSFTALKLDMEYWIGMYTSGNVHVLAEIAALIYKYIQILAYT